MIPALLIKPNEVCECLANLLMIKATLNLIFLHHTNILFKI
jgi:hypothetical protein